MALKGSAFMIVWHDIRTEAEPEYHRWHTREHMPERLGVPGFLRGRRGVDWGRDRHRYLTLYEGRDLDTFGAPAYLARLNNPTPWTNQLQPSFYNFIRSACAIVCSSGRGVGGAMATLRVPFGSRQRDQLRADAEGLTGQVMALDGISSFHIGVARPDVTSAKTRETELRGMSRDGVFDAVVLVDGIGRREVEAVMSRIVSILDAKGWTVPEADSAVYDMAFMLEPE